LQASWKLSDPGCAAVSVNPVRVGGACYPVLGQLEPKLGQN